MRFSPAVLPLVLAACGDPLADDLTSGDSARMAEAALGVGLSGRASPAQTRALLGDMAGDDWSVVVATWALAQLDEAATSRRVALSRLQHPNGSVRAMACWALLEQFPDDDAVRDAVRERLEDPDHQVRRVAAGALAR